MKKYIFILFSIIIYGCNAQKSKSDIVYLLPTSVKDILYKEVQKKKKEGKEVGFVLDKENTETYIIYVSTVSNSSKRFWLKYSNRSVFLEGELIPLYFDMDEYFSSPEKGKIVLKKLRTEEGIKTTIHNRENAFQIKFKSDGEIIK